MTSLCELRPSTADCYFLHFEADIKGAAIDFINNAYGELIAYLRTGYLS